MKSRCSQRSAAVVTTPMVMVMLSVLVTVLSCTSVAAVGPIGAGFCLTFQDPFDVAALKLGLLDFNSNNRLLNMSTSITVGFWARYYTTSSRIIMPVCTSTMLYTICSVLIETMALRCAAFQWFADKNGFQPFAGAVGWTFGTSVNLKQTLTAEHMPDWHYYTVSWASNTGRVVYSVDGTITTISKSGVGLGKSLQNEGTTFLIVSNSVCLMYDVNELSLHREQTCTPGTVSQRE